MSSYSSSYFSFRTRGNRLNLVPVPQAETWKTACNVPGPLDIPSPLAAAANPHGLQERHSHDTQMYAEALFSAWRSSAGNLQKVLDR